VIDMGDNAKVTDIIHLQLNINTLVVLLARKNLGTHYRESLFESRY